MTIFTFIAVLSAIVFAYWIKWLFAHQDRVTRNLTQQAEKTEEAALALEGILSNAPIGYMELDVQGCVTRVNALECKFRGLEPNQIVGKKYWDLESTEDRERGRKDFLRDILGDVELVPFRRKLDKGGTTSVEVSAQYVRGLRGRTRGIRFFSVDITQTIRLEEEVVQRNQKSHAMLVAFPDAVFHLDKYGSILEYKPAPHLALSPEGILGRRLVDVLPPDAQELIHTNLHFALTSHSERTVEYCFQSDNKPIYCEFRMVPFTWDQIAVLVRDITARKMAHDKAQQHARELVHKNEELTHALTDAQESKAIKTELIQKVSLELQTPMSGIVGMTAKVLDTKLDGEQRQIVEAVRTSSQTVLSILSNILDASRLESRLLPVENRPFGVRDVIQKVVSGIRGHASKKGLHLEWGVAKEIPVTIQGDPVRLEKVLVNLLENGIKFTSQGQVGLEVGLAGETKEDWTLKFTVQDTGIGISSDKLPTIFDGYTRVDGGKSRAMGNSGLGLAICKQLIEMMAGGITVESSPSKGSIFQFTAVFEKCVLNPLSATESGVSYDSSGEILSWGYR